MALSRKVKERIFRNKVRRLYRFPANVWVDETDVSTFHPYQRSAVGNILLTESRGLRGSPMPKIFLYVSKGPSHGPV